MARMQLVELEDLPWFPAVWRHAVTDWLDFITTVTPRPYLRLLPKLAAAMRAAETTELVALGAGGGGAAPLVARLLAEREGIDATVTLTDLYPDRERFEHRAAADPRVRFRAESVDAGAVPAELSGLRICFNMFHHLPPPVARRVLEDAHRQRRAVCVFEIVGRSAPAFASILFSPLSVLLTMPLVRPFRAASWLFTYLLPVVPAVALFDGTVSCLRVYSPAELDALVADLRAGYRWETGLLPVDGMPGARVTYLLGHPLP